MIPHVAVLALALAGSGCRALAEYSPPPLAPDAPFPLDFGYAGQEGHPCYPNGSCQAGLTCEANVCVAPTDGLPRSNDGDGPPSCDVQHGLGTCAQPLTSLYVGGLRGCDDGDIQDGSSPFASPVGLAIHQGTVFVADRDNHRIRAVTCGKVLTVAGTGHAGAKDGAKGTNQLRTPSDVIVDRATQSLLVADTGNNAIRRIDLQTLQVSTPWRIDGVRSLALVNDNLYALTRRNQVGNVWQLGPPGSSGTEVAIQGVPLAMAADSAQKILYVLVLKGEAFDVTLVSPPAPALDGATGGGGYEMGPPDMGPSDRGPSDRGPSDRGPPDTGPPDRGPPDTGPPDTGPSDMGPPDRGPPDVDMDRASPDANQAATPLANMAVGHTPGRMVFRDGALILADSSNHRLLKIEAVPPHGTLVLAGPAIGALQPMVTADYALPFGLAVDPADGTLVVGELDAFRLQGLEENE